MTTQMRVYVGTYAKYNSGNLFGAWLALDDYSDKEAFFEAAHRLHKGETDPELMFQDWEGIPASMVSECSVSASLWEIMDETNQEAVVAYLSIFGEWDAEDFQERYRGEWSSWADMAEELLEETGQLEAIPESLRNYFDFEAYARDIRLNGDMTEDNGHYFWNH